MSKSASNMKKLPVQLPFELSGQPGETSREPIEGRLEAGEVKGSSCLQEPNKTQGRKGGAWCQCQRATLYPDGRVRCDFGEKLATEECEKQEAGSVKIYKPERIIVQKAVRKSRRG